VILKRGNMELKKKIINKLKEIIDPELMEDVWSLKLIKDLEVDKNNKSVSLKFRPTAYHCPLGIQIAMNIKKKLLQIEEIDNVNLKVVDFIMAEKANKYLEEM